jgi:hypothetical protein
MGWKDINYLNCIVLLSMIYDYYRRNIFSVEIEADFVSMNKIGGC